ncbi:MAG: NCS2 family permease, partial [Nitrospinota bacterium]|nr:NCS2 family permease [Nitrospinota bacterium]
MRSETRTGRLPYFVRGDLDGFFGLLIDNLVNLMLIVSLCTGLLGMPAALVFGRILPGAAVSILLGNVFYAWQARRLARRLGRDDLTALPYGINTVTLFAFIFFVMLPVYRASGDPDLAWRVG